MGCSTRRTVEAAGCTIGGNVAENSGGAHCLKNGFTVNHVLELRARAARRRGRRAAEGDEPDLLGAVVGSEGTLGIVTRRRARVPGGRRPSTLLAGFDDRTRPRAAVRDDRSRDPARGDRDDGRAHGPAAEAAVAPGTRRARAPSCSWSSTASPSRSRRTWRPCASSPARAAREVRVAPDEAERALLWRGARAFAAMGRVATDYYVQDGVAATRLPPSARRSASRALQAAGRQRLPRRRRQPPPARALRRRGRRGGAGEDARGGDPRGLHGRGRLAHRRARHRRGQGLRDAAHVRGSATCATFERLRRAFDPDGLANPGKCCRRRGLRRGAGPSFRAHPLETRACRASLVSRRRPSLASARRAPRPRVRIGSTSRRRLDAVLEHEAGDLDLHGRGGHPALGARRGASRTRAAPPRPARRPHGRRLPRRALERPRRHRFGTPRDLVLGVTLVLADGTVANAGGKVVKNVAGYDLGARLRLARDARADRASLTQAAPEPGGIAVLGDRDGRPAPSSRRCAARSSCRAPSTSCLRDAWPCSSRAARRRWPRRSRPRVARRRRRGGRRGLGRAAAGRPPLEASSASRPVSSPSGCRSSSRARSFERGRAWPTRRVTLCCRVYPPPLAALQAHPAAFDPQGILAA